MIITSPHYNRPHCTAQMLAYLKECEHINDVGLFFLLEPGCDEVHQMVEDFDHPRKRVIKNDRLLGCWTSKKKIINEAFKHTDFVFHVEDDLLLAPDTIRMIIWMMNTYKDKPSIFSCSTFNGHIGGLLNYPCPCCGTNTALHQIGRRPAYNSIGFGIWKDRWDEFADDWNGRDIDLHEIYRKDRYEVYPLVSRINHIGFDNGVVTHPDMYDVLHTISRGTNNETQWDATLERWKRINPDLLTTHQDREWIKLDDKNARSRKAPEFYKDYYFLKEWAGNIDLPDGQFFDWGRMT